MRAVRALTASLGGSHASTLIGGGWSARDRAAFYNVALSRYLDLMDSYLRRVRPTTVGQSWGCPGCDGERGWQRPGFPYRAGLRLSGPHRLSDVAPVRAKGFEHTTQSAYAVAAGAAPALRLDASQTANSIAIAGTANNALRVTRTGELSHWKGLAYIRRSPRRASTRLCWPGWAHRTAGGLHGRRTFCYWYGWCDAATSPGSQH